jgi:hypothetical protein
MLNILSDILATLFPSQLEIPRKELPSIDKTSVIYELKHHLVILAQMAAAGAPPNSGSTTTSDIVSHITKILLPNWIQRGIFTAEDGNALEEKVQSHASKDISQIAEELRLDQEIDAISPSNLYSESLSLDKTLPNRHHLPGHPDASWDTLPAMNGLFLRRIRGFPLRAGGLQNGLELQNAGSYPFSIFSLSRLGYLELQSPHVPLSHQIHQTGQHELTPRKTKPPQARNPPPKPSTTSQRPTPPPSASRGASRPPRRSPTSTASAMSFTPPPQQQRQRQRNHHNKHHNPSPAAQHNNQPPIPLPTTTKLPRPPSFRSPPAR